MPKQLVFAVMDSAMDAYMRPFYAPTANAAVRSFTDEVNRPSEDNPLYKHPDDYSLHELAEFNENTGEFINTGRMLVRAKDLVKEPK